MVCVEVNSDPLAFLPAGRGQNGRAITVKALPLLISTEIKIEGNWLFLRDEANGLTVANVDVCLGIHLSVNGDVLGEAIGSMREVEVKIDDVGAVGTSNCV